MELFNVELEWDLGFVIKAILLQIVRLGGRSLEGRACSCTYIELHDTVLSLLRNKDNNKLLALLSI